ncbi:MAG: ThuA domain-containing protein [Planctomycetales bacterium]
MKLLRVICLLTILSLANTWTQAEDAPKKARMLMVTQSQGFVHKSVNREKNPLSPAEIAMTQLGQQTGLFSVDCTQHADKDFTEENLKKYDLVFFYTTGNLPIAEKDWDYFFNTWMKQKGHGFIGRPLRDRHVCHFQALLDFIGGTFDGHPWGSNNTVTITVHDTDHAASKPWGKEFQIKDEIYQYKNWQPEKVHVLMSLDMAKCNPSKPYLVPVSWVKQYGDGRMYYTNLGHNPET